MRHWQTRRSITTIAAVTIASVAVVASATASTSQPSQSNLQRSQAADSKGASSTIDPLEADAPEPAAQKDFVAEEPASASPQPVSSTNTSLTTVTVNGETVTVGGDGTNGSYEKSYISSDGTTKVQISVEHESSSTSKPVTRHRGEAAME